jgi:hypothetical protein
MASRWRAAIGEGAWPRRLTLLLITPLAGLSYAWALNRRLRWIATHCLKVGKPTAGLDNYYCVPANA